METPVTSMSDHNSPYTLTIDHIGRGPDRRLWITYDQYQHIPSGLPFEINLVNHTSLDWISAKVNTITRNIYIDDEGYEHESSSMESRMVKYINGRTIQLPELDASRLNSKKRVVEHHLEVTLYDPNSDNHITYNNNIIIYVR